MKCSQLLEKLVWVFSSWEGLTLPFMRIPSALPTGKHLCLCCSIKFPGGPKGGLLQHSSLPRSRGSWLTTMRLLVLTSLLCILLLCLSVFSAEGRTLPCPAQGAGVWAGILWSGMVGIRKCWRAGSPGPWKTSPMNPYGASIHSSSTRGRLRSLKPRNLSTVPAPRAHTH